jgi:hypothetical protein
MSELQFDNPSAPDYDWQKDREWFNQRLANARLHNSDLEQRIAQIKSVAFNTRHTHVERIRQIRALLESRLSPTAKS